MYVEIVFNRIMENEKKSHPIDSIVNAIWEKVQGNFIGILEHPDPSVEKRRRYVRGAVCALIELGSLQYLNEAKTPEQVALIVGQAILGLMPGVTAIKGACIKKEESPIPDSE